MRAVLGDPEGFPNCRLPGTHGHVLEYAIYHSPLAFIRRLLEIGARPVYEDHAGFPPLIAALSTDRADKYEIIEALLAAGADIQQRGFNGYTPLHHAANQDDPTAIELLLAHGADPAARTDVDDFTTPLEEAEALGRTRAADTLKAAVKS